jgi:hypothetical protein
MQPVVEVRTKRQVRAKFKWIAAAVAVSAFALVGPLLAAIGANNPAPIKHCQSVGTTVTCR